MGKTRETLLHGLGRVASAMVLGLAVAAVLAGCSTGDPSVGSSPDAAASETRRWADIEASGTLRVGTEGTYSPYSYHDNVGDLTGYDVELMEAIGAELGLEVEFCEMGFDELAAGLDDGRFDVVADQICVTDERQESYLFSEPYAYVTGAVVTRDDYDGIESFEDLDGKRVALTETSNWARLAESYGAEIVPTKGFSESMRAVLDGKADATVNDNLVFLDYMEEHPGSHAKMAVTADETDTVALLMGKYQTQLREKVDGAMGALRADGTIKRLSEKYFGKDVSEAKTDERVPEKGSDDKAEDLVGDGSENAEKEDGKGSERENNR